jgi:hypothetical protein
MDPMMAALALGSTALTAIGKLGSGYAASDADKFQAMIADKNAQLLTEKAKAEAAEGTLATDEATLQQSRTIEAVKRTIGSQTSRFTGSNLDPTMGSPLLLAGFTAAQGEMDLALEGAKGTLGVASALGQSAGTMAAAAGEKGKSASFNIDASQQVMAGWLGAGTALLSGATSMKQYSALAAATGQVAGGGGGMPTFAWSGMG